MSLLLALLELIIYVVVLCFYGCSASGLIYWITNKKHNSEIDSMFNDLFPDDTCDSPYMNEPDLQEECKKMKSGSKGQEEKTGDESTNTEGDSNEEGGDRE